MTHEYRANNVRVIATVTKPDKGDGLGPSRMLIHVDKKYRVKASSVLFSIDNEAKYLLAEHHSYGRFDVFMGYPINTQLALQMTEAIHHPVSKNVVERRSLGPVKRVWACEDIITPDQVLGLQVPKRVFYLGTEVRDTDTLDGQRIKEVLKTQGLWRVEVS